MIDTHAHINDRFGKVEIPTIPVVLAASSVEESETNINLAKKYANLYASVGIHPQQTDPDNSESVEEQIKKLDELVCENRNLVVAIGECGLDYSPAPPGEADRSKSDQEKVFKSQIELSIKYNLPLIIHARKAVDEVIGILSKYPKARGVFHCYSGGKKRINKVLGLGDDWYFGMDGNLTYEDGLVEVVKNIAKDRLLAETDSPFLTPVPYRGEVNKPEYVEFVYKKIAEIWQVSFEEAQGLVDKNAKKLFLDKIS